MSPWTSIRSSEIKVTFVNDVAIEGWRLCKYMHDTLHQLNQVGCTIIHYMHIILWNSFDHFTVNDMRLCMFINAVVPIYTSNDVILKIVVNGLENAER